VCIWLPSTDRNSVDWTPSCVRTSFVWLWRDGERGCSTYRSTAPPPPRAATVSIQFELRILKGKKAGPVIRPFTCGSPSCSCVAAERNADGEASRAICLAAVQMQPRVERIIVLHYCKLRVPDRMHPSCADDPSGPARTNRALFSTAHCNCSWAVVIATAGRWVVTTLQTPDTSTETSRHIHGSATALFDSRGVWGGQQRTREERSRTHASYVRDDEFPLRCRIPSGHFRREMPNRIGMDRVLTYSPPSCMYAVCTLHLPHAPQRPASRWTGAPEQRFSPRRTLPQSADGRDS